MKPVFKINSPSIIKISSIIASVVMHSSNALSQTTAIISQTASIIRVYEEFTYIQHLLIYDQFPPLPLTKDGRGELKITYNDGIPGHDKYEQTPTFGNIYSEGTKIIDGTVSISYSNGLSNGPVEFAAKPDSSGVTLKALQDVSIGNRVKLTSDATLDSENSFMEFFGPIEGNGKIKTKGNIILSGTNSNTNDIDIDTGILEITQQGAISGNGSQKPSLIANDGSTLSCNITPVSNLIAEVTNPITALKTATINAKKPIKISGPVATSTDTILNIKGGSSANMTGSKSNTIKAVNVSEAGTSFYMDASFDTSIPFSFGDGTIIESNIPFILHQILIG